MTRKQEQPPVELCMWMDITRTTIRSMLRESGCDAAEKEAFTEYVELVISRVGDIPATLRKGVEDEFYLGIYSLAVMAAAECIVAMANDRIFGKDGRKFDPTKALRDMLKTCTDKPAVGPIIETSEGGKPS